MSLKGTFDCLKELYMVNNMKNKGYSMIDIVGEDGNVEVYFKKIKTKKSVEIDGGTHVINNKKRLTKWEMPYFRFTKCAFGEDKTGKVTVTQLDADVATELISKARLAGQNSGSNDKNKLLYIAMGGAIGFLACWIILGIVG